MEDSRPRFLAAFTCRGWRRASLAGLCRKVLRSASFWAAFIRRVHRVGFGTGPSESSFAGSWGAFGLGLLEKNLKGGMVVVGGLNLGGSIETIFNPVAVVAADKGARVILMPIATRRQLVDLPDDVATRVVISYYLDAKDALSRRWASGGGVWVRAVDTLPARLAG